LSVRDAARSLLDTRRKDDARSVPSAQGSGQSSAQGDTQDQPGEARDDATAQELQDSPAQAEDAGPDRVPGETQEASPEETPPVEPPRSWTKEDKELFKSLPRDTQERLVERERLRESDFLRRQNESAEKLKGLTAQQQQAEQVRMQYEHALPMLLQALQEQHAGEFADITSIADIERLAREDWPRYVVWDAQQKKVAAVQQQVQATQARQATETAQRWHTFAHQQDRLFEEKAPELADGTAKARATEGAVAMLKDLGFTDAELGKMWHGQQPVSLRDHRIQLLLRDAVKYRDAQAAARKAAARAAPPVQRPGTPAPRGADADERVKALDAKLTQSGKVEDAARFLAARRAANRR
jgi:hypothetical protein